MKTFTKAVAGFCISLCLMGCSGTTGGVGPGMEPQEAVMKELGDLLRSGSGNPKSLGDLAQFETHFPKAFQAIKSGDIVVNWGTPMLGEGEAATSQGSVVASEKDARGSGGWILLTNGKARKVTSAEFGGLSPASK